MKRKKSLGQHFLRSRQIIDDIVRASGTKTGDAVLEVGPGEGILTKALIEKGAKVIAVEKDDRLIPELQKKFSKEIAAGQLNLIHGDILDILMSKRHFDIGQADILNINMSKRHFDIGSPYKIVANIPYYITGQILRMFLESDKQPESMTLLVQKEVAERIVARNGKESLLSLSVKIFGKPKIIRVVGRGAFSPQPNVDSAVTHIENINKKKLKDLDEKNFFKIIRAGFAHKRKQLLGNLSSIYKKEFLIGIFLKLGLNSKIRAEDLPFDTWIKICKMLESTK